MREGGIPTSVGPVSPGWSVPKPLDRPTYNFRSLTSRSTGSSGCSVTQSTPSLIEKVVGHLVFYLKWAIPSPIYMSWRAKWFFHFYEDGRSTLSRSYMGIDQGWIKRLQDDRLAFWSMVPKWPTIWYAFILTINMGGKLDLGPAQSPRYVCDTRSSSNFRDLTLLTIAWGPRRDLIMV